MTVRSRIMIILLNKQCFVFSWLKWRLQKSTTSSTDWISSIYRVDAEPGCFTCGKKKPWLQTIIKKKSLILWHDEAYKCFFTWRLCDGKKFMRQILTNNREGLISSIYLLQKIKTYLRKSYIYYKYSFILFWFGFFSPICICLNNFWNCYNPTSVQDTKLDDSEDELQRKLP